MVFRARVFVGNMNTNVITREDIIRLFSAYGHLLGVTVFKGYAFIQYGNAADADLAVSTLNGYNWNGSILGIFFFVFVFFKQNISVAAFEVKLHSYHHSLLVSWTVIAHNF